MSKRMTVIALIEDSVVCSCVREDPCEYALGCKQYALVEPAKLAQVEEDARIGKAVRELLVGPFEINGTMDFQCGYAQALRWVTQAVNKS